MDVLGRRVAPGDLAGVSVFGRVMACTQVRGRVHRRRTGDPIILRTREISNCFSMQRTMEATNSGARQVIAPPVMNTMRAATGGCVADR